MCLICVDFQKQKMTINDAKRAFREMVTDMTPEHAREVRKMIRKAEQDENKSTPPNSGGGNTP
ncbi:MAG: hypothetical protein AAFX99_29635 [Myxococcota bacterium]